jgi:hypothetical protein
MPAKRRKSYIAVVLNKHGREQTLHFKSYDETYPREYCEGRGWQVLSIKLKPRQSKAWAIDDAAFAQAVEFLGLRHPIFLDYTSSYKNAGTYSLRYGWALPKSAPARLRHATLVHRIMVRRADSAADVSRALWHELCHAMQAERELSTAGGYGAYSRKVDAEKLLPYRVRPSEIEAREYEAFHDEMPLTRAI